MEGITEKQWYQDAMDVMRFDFACKRNAAMIGLLLVSRMGYAFNSMWRECQQRDRENLPILTAWKPRPVVS